MFLAFLMKSLSLRILENFCMRLQNNECISVHNEPLQRAQRCVAA